MHDDETPFFKAVHKLRRSNENIAHFTRAHVAKSTDNLDSIATNIPQSSDLINSDKSKSPTQTDTNPIESFVPTNIVSTQIQNIPPTQATASIQSSPTLIIPTQTTSSFAIAHSSTTAPKLPSFNPNKNSAIPSTSSPKADCTLEELLDNILRLQREQSTNRKCISTDNLNNILTDYNSFNQYTNTYIRNLTDWSYSQNTRTNSSNSNMATPIKEITDLIKEYKGEEKHLHSFIKNIDKLWAHIANHEQNDKNRFLLVLQIKLTEKAAEAVKNIDFVDWPTVKAALKAYIKPQKNVEKLELKLTTVKQLPKEDIETYAKRVENLMEDLNLCFEAEEGFETMKKENNRKARKSFENGLFSPKLKDKAIAKGCTNLKDVIDYTVEQELRQPSIQPFCINCKTATHDTADCKSKTQLNKTNTTPQTFVNSQSFVNNAPPTFATNTPRVFNNNSSRIYTSRYNNEPARDRKTIIICYKCNKQGHYAPECRAFTRPRIENPSVVCYKCGKPGHYAPDCRNLNRPTSLNLPSTSYNQNPTYNQTPRYNQNPIQNQNQNFRNLNPNYKTPYQKDENRNANQTANNENIPNNIRIYETEIPIEEASAEIEVLEEQKN